MRNTRKSELPSCQCIFVDETKFSKRDSTDVGDWVTVTKVVEGDAFSSLMICQFIKDDGHFPEDCYWVIDSFRLLRYEIRNMLTTRKSEFPSN